MKVLVVSDLHGRTCWRKPVKKFLSTAGTADRVVFLGDYNDSFDVTDELMLENFRAILRLKQRHTTQVVLLLGNHCLPYLLYPDPVFRCAGFRPSLAPRLAKLYQTHKSYFKVAFAAGRTLLVHAGVSEKWLTNNALLLLKLTGHDAYSTDTYSIAEVLNALLDTQAGYYLLWQASPDNGGTERYDSPLWVRPARLLKDGLLSGWIQVIGHTEVSSPARFDDVPSRSGFILTDCLASIVPQWLTLDFSYQSVTSVPAIIISE